MRKKESFSTTFVARGLLLFAVASAAEFTAAGVARADCTHRYSFTDGVKDSVGKADGTLKGAAKVADGQLTLTNTDKYCSDNDVSYVDFAAPILPKEGSVSIVMWFTGKDCGPFSRLLDIGKNGDAAAFIYLTPRTSEDQSRVAISAADTGSKTAVDAPLFDDGKPHMVALVVDAPAKKLREFIDGKEVGTPADLGDNTLDKEKQEHSWIGRSSFDSDPALTGTIQALAIFDQPLTADELSNQFTAGPHATPAK